MKTKRFALLLPAVFSFVSCNMDDSNEIKAGNEPVEVMYRVSISDHYEASAAYFSAPGTVITKDQIKDSWTSGQFTVRKTEATISATASPDSDHFDTTEEGELTLQILVNGKVEKEVKATGKIISIATNLLD